MPSGTQAHALYIEGADLAEQGSWVGALDRFAQATVLQPDFAPYQNNAGIAAWKLGHLDEAGRYFETALRLDPENGNYHYHFGRVHESASNWMEALASYLAASETLDEAKVHHRIGLVLARVGRFAMAARSHRAAADRSPADAEAWHALAINLCSMRALSEADQAWRRAVEVQPEYHAAASHSLLAMHYCADAEPASIFAAHRKWGSLVESKVARFPPRRAPKNGRIRIGYLSPDLDSHAVSYFAEPLLRNHDRNAMETSCFWDRQAPGGEPRLQSLVDRWHDTSRLTNAECADLIRSEKIDVLIDLAGHTSPQNRLLVLAAKPARVQMTAIGYPDTTGLSTVDFRLSDSVCDPMGMTERYHSEKLLRLDPCFLCYAPPEDAPEIANADGNRPFTFGCFNALPKVTDTVLDAWAEILTRTPESRLLLTNLEFADPDIRAAVHREFAHRGVNPERIDLRAPVATRRSLLMSYAEVDLALDPFPYNGAATTCESLWMGVPVVTLRGNQHVSRVTTSILSCCGLDRWIAGSQEEYVTLAVLAAGRRASAKDRRQLRQRVRTSPLLDGRSYTKRFERLLRTALLEADQINSSDAVNC